MTKITVASVVGCLLVGLLVLGQATADGADAETSDIEAVKKYLAANHDGATWGQGPTRLKGDAVEAAYPDARFYYVFSPQYPVARVGRISMLMRIDKEGKVVQVSTPQDFSAGLMKIGNVNDAKTAAAAIMSLTFGPFGPMPVEAKDVEAKPDGKGWTCSATAGQGGPRGKPHVFRVSFDADGNCTEATHTFTGPLPICIGGLFLPVAAPTGIAGLAHEIGGTLETVSVEPDSIADRAGLRPGDIILSFDGKPLPGGDVIQQMRQTVYPLKQQGNVSRTIDVLRSGKTIRLTLCW